MPEVKKTKKRDRKVSTNGVAHVQASFNNTIVTITDMDGAVITWAQRGQGRLQGLAQEHAVRGAGGRGGVRPRGHQPRHEAGRGLGEGPRGGARGGHPFAAGGGARDLGHQGRHPHPAQRLPPAQAAPGLGERHGGRPGCALPQVPAREHEALPQGRPLLHGQVRDRAPRLRAGRARQEPQDQGDELRRAAAREAEGAPHVRRPRAAVPQLLREGGRVEGRHRRDAAPDARAPSRQRDLPAGLRGEPQPGPAARPPRPHHGERPQGGHPLVPGEAG